MADKAHTPTTEGQPAKSDDHGGAAAIDLIPDPIVVGWTWGVFLIMLLILYKVAWKPILAGLDKREENIKRSIEEAEEIEQRLAEIKSQQDEMIADADERAKGIVSQARGAATEAARTIETKAKEEAQILLENATREISAMSEKAKAGLQRESAELAISLAGRILDENLDNDRHRALTEKIISEL